MRAITNCVISQPNQMSKHSRSVHFCQRRVTVEGFSFSVIACVQIVPISQAPITHVLQQLLFIVLIFILVYCDKIFQWDLLSLQILNVQFFTSDCRQEVVQESPGLVVSAFTCRGLSATYLGFFICCFCFLLMLQISSSQPVTPLGGQMIHSQRSPKTLRKKKKIFMYIMIHKSRKSAVLNQQGK